MSLMSQKGRFLSIVVLVSHLLFMVWYHSHSIEWVVENRVFAKQLFFGFQFILIGISFLIPLVFHVRNPLHLEVAKIHAFYIIFLGIVYWMHYSGVVTKSAQQLGVLMLSILFIFIVILISAMSHGLFKTKT